MCNNINWIIGGASTNNSLTVNAGAYLKTAKGNGTNWFAIGKDSGGNQNSVTVTGSGASWVGTTVKFGVAGNDNSLTVSNGGFVQSEKLLIGTEGGGDRNAALITGTGSNFQTESGNNGQFSVGISTNAQENSLTVANGANATLTWSRVSFGFGIGTVNGADNNYVRVTGTGSTLVSTIGTPVTLGGVNVTSGSSGTDSTASGNHFDVYSGGSATLNQPVHLMGTASAFNLGDGTGTSTATVGAKTGWTSGVYLQKADATLNFNSGRLIAAAAGALVSGPGTVNLNGPAIIDTGSNANSIDSVINGTGSGGSLTKQGSGTLTLSNTNNYVGPTVVSAGTLTLSATGSIANSSTITVGNSAGSTASLNVSALGSGLSVGTSQTLKGAGSVTGSVNVSGVLAPGNSIETLFVSGDLTMLANSVFQFESNANAAAGQEADLLVVGGNLSLSSVKLDLNAIDLASAAWGLNEVLTLVNYGGSPITGGFTDMLGNPYDNGSSYTFGGNQWKFTYDSGSAGGNFGAEASGFNNITIEMVGSGGGPGPVDHFVIDPISSPQTVGTAITGIKVTALDASNNTATSFTGTVTFGGTSGCSGTTANFAGGVLTGASAIPTTAGTNLTLTVDDGSGHTGSVLIATIQTQYVAWIDTNYPGIPVADRDPGDDPDHDGLTNEQEFAFGLVPNDGKSCSPWVTTPDRSTGTFSYTRRKNTGITCSYQYSTSLGGAWTPLSSPPESATGDPIETVTVTLPPALVSGNDKLFIHIVTN